jgi:signal transduction histidine kinase/ActR/RegA family two-component response regulator
MDACKPGFRLDDYMEKLADAILPKRINLTGRMRLIRFALLFVFLTILTSAFVGLIYYQDLLAAIQHEPSFKLLLNNFIKVYSALLVFIGLCTWWLILNDESRRVAQEEISKQTQRLVMEIEEHTKTDSKLQEATKAADHANIAKSRFLSNMSHEIRTPLNSIIGYAYILQKDPTIPAHRRQAVDILKRSGEHLSSLIEDILDIARIEACKFEIAKDAIDFPKFIEHILSIFKPQAEAKRLAFSCQMTSTLPARVRGDEKRVGQILINLLGNAIKFTVEGEVIFRIGYSCGVTTFHIIDTGPGIEQGQLDNIFQPFTQLANDNLVSGSGLGLTISKVLTEIMGGELTVHSIPDQGSTFIVRLYLANLGAEHEKTRQEAIVGYHERTHRILVVDDQCEHRQLIKDILEPVGFGFDEAYSGAECLLKTVANQPDLILLDLSMPDMDGLETARRLRQQGYTLPIVVLSSNAYASDRVNAINAGCNDFLAKPLQVSKMLNKLKIQLGLTWIYETDDKAVPEKMLLQNPEQLPPPDVLEAISGHVRIGDLLGLNQYLAEFGDSHPEFQEFVQHIMRLSGEFQIAGIKKIIALTTEKINDYDEGII